ncbi:hypothetical protein BC826DRAFT_470843 [Russula brevipes]|nr:hypothetical protein BC826DRAFT_470843 [Russula brevipes]
MTELTVVVDVRGHLARSGKPPPSASASVHQITQHPRSQAHIAYRMAQYYCSG